jgi:hypothetical protein
LGQPNILLAEAPSSPRASPPHIAADKMVEMAAGDPDRLLQMLGPVNSSRA